MSCLTSKTLQNTDELFFQQINTSCLSQFSYYIESYGEALIIDPMRDIDQYKEILKTRGAKLKYVLETHFHADFVSGHIDLSKETGAVIVYGPTAKPEFEAKIAEDKEQFQLGKVTIEVIHTPGHTLESSSYLLLDSQKNPLALFTGDFLFLGEVGRPDLAVKGDITEETLASYLFDSLKKISYIPDTVLIYPGHGAGSPCGKNISSGGSDTLGNQRKTNWAMNQNISKQEFVEIATSNLSTPPQYFFHDVFMNKKGYEEVSKVVEQEMKALKPEEFLKILEEDKTIVVLDTRDSMVSSKEFFTSSYLISLKMTYAIWVGTLFVPNTKFIIIAEPGKEKESILRLSRIGYETILGYLEGGWEPLKQYLQTNVLQDKISSLEPIDLNDIQKVLSQQKFELVDVREKGEWESTGVLPGSHLLSLSQFEKNIEKVKSWESENKFGVYCRTGARSTVAGSILKKYGFKNVINLGGILNMIEKGVKLVPK